MREFPFVSCPDYDFWSEPIEEKKILVPVPDGGRALIRHRTLTVRFRHKKTKDVISFRMTGRGNFYVRGTYYKKEERTTESDTIDVFKRLIGKDGETAFQMAKTRLYME